MTDTLRVFTTADPPGLARVRDRHGNTWTYTPNPGHPEDNRTWLADNRDAVIAADPDLREDTTHPTFGYTWSGRRSFGLLVQIYGPLTEITE